MKVRLTVQPPSNGFTHSSTEPVRGVVTLQTSHTSEVSAISLRMEGIVMAALIDTRPGWPIAGDDDLLDRHKVCSVSKPLFPAGVSPNQAGGFSLPKGVHRISFEIAFPRLSSCERGTPGIHHLVTALPPSFSSHTPSRNATAVVEYLLKVDVRRPGKFQRGSSAEQKLPYCPPNPSAPCPSTSLRDCVASSLVKLDEPWAKRQQPAGQQQQQSKSPNEGRPVLLLESRLASSATLYSGERVPLGLVLRRFPAASGRPVPVQLRTLTVRLKGTTTIRLDSKWTSWDSSEDLLVLKDLNCSVDSDSFEINSDILDKVVVPKPVLPSFTTCTVRQEYAVEVIVGFLVDKEEKLSLLRTKTNVEVYSGEGRTEPSVLPEYTLHPEYMARTSNTPAISSTPRSEEASFVPLRVGYMQHLGIGRGFGQDNLPPPAYCV